MQTEVGSRLVTASGEAAAILYTLPRPGGGYRRSLFELIKRFNGSIATDPRDKIYSLLGIAEPYTKGHLSVDYTSTWQQVYSRTAKYIIQGSQSLDILASAGSASDLKSLPSWVPDFARQSVLDYCRGDPTIPDPQAIIDMKKFRAGGLEVSNMEFFENDRFLGLEAILVGKISHILPRQQSGSTLGVIEELERRMNYLSIDYLRTGSRITGSVLLCLTGFIAKMLYCATFELPDSAAHHQLDDQWPVIDFLRTCIDAVTRSKTAPITPARLSRLETVFSKPKSMFKVNLPPPFSLLGNLLPSLTRPQDLTAQDRQTIASIPSFQVPGYCRVQEGGAQGDYVAVVPGCKLPLILRPLVPEDHKVMHVVSEAYVYGLMDGEVLGLLPRQRIVLV